MTLSEVLDKAFGKEQKIDAVVVETKPTMQPFPTSSTPAFGGLICGAIDAIEKYGWTRAKLGSPSTGFCVVGALIFAYAQKHGLTNDHAYRFGIPMEVGMVSSFLSRRVNMPITAWNDQPDRTKEQVLALLKEHSLCD